MKRYNNIFESIVDIKNIELAIEKASCHKKRRKSVQNVLQNKEIYAEKIREMLINKTYVPSKYTVMTIYDGARHKERTIYKPRFYPDQVIHWALMLQIGNILQKRFYYYSCASIKGKGTDFAFKQVKKAMNSNCKYCLKLDIKKFYPSIDKEILKAKFRRVFKDEDLLWLIDTVIDGNETQGEGLPIGNYSSQWFANFFLTDLDNYIKTLNVKYYIRYMDDMIIFHTNKRRLRKIKEWIVEFLKKEKLEIKRNWQIINTHLGMLDFLGYRFYTDHITLRRSNFLRIKRRIKKVSKKPFINETDSSAVISYDGFLKRSDCHTFLKRYVYPFISVNYCKKLISRKEKYEANQQYAIKLQLQH